MFTVQTIFFLLSTMDFQNVLDENSPPKKCAKAHCKTLIPVGSPYKQCQPCRERQRGLSQQHRARQKASDATNASAGSKRAQEGGQLSEARPIKRARAVECEGTTDDTESDEEGEDLFGSFEKTVRISFYIKTFIINLFIP